MSPIAIGTVIYGAIFVGCLAALLACAFVLGHQPEDEQDERELAEAQDRHPSASRPTAAPPLLPYIPRPRDGGPNNPRSKP